MKTNKKNKIKRVISGVLASTLLFESCMQNPEIFYIEKSVPDINKNTNNYRKGSGPFSILNINLSNEDSKYFGFINKLSCDILTNPSIAQNFINNPQSYLEASGYPNLIINLDDGLIKMITALGDEEIHQAISSNNIQEFIQLCKNKNLMSSIQIADIERVNKLIEKNPELLRLLNIDGPQDMINVAFAVVIVVGAVVAIWAITVTHAVAVNVVGAGTVVVAAFAATWSWKAWGVCDDCKTLLQNKDPHLLQVWALKGGNPNNTYLMLNEYENTQINDFLNILQNEYPEKFLNVDKESLKQVIALNLKQLSH